MEISFNNLPTTVQQYRFNDIVVEIKFGSYAGERRQP